MIVSWDGGFVTSVVDVGTDVVAVRVAFEYGVSVTAEFEFPVSVVLVVDTGGDTVGVGLDSGWDGPSGEPVTSRQVALTRRCVSSRWKHRPHFVHLILRGIVAGGRSWGVVAGQ